MVQWWHHASTLLLILLELMSSTLLLALLVLLSSTLLLVLLSSTLLLELLVLLLLVLLLVLLMDVPIKSTIIPILWVSPVTAPLVSLRTLRWCNAQVVQLCFREPLVGGVRALQCTKLQPTNQLSRSCES